LKNPGIKIPELKNPRIKIPDSSSMLKIIIENPEIGMQFWDEFWDPRFWVNDRHSI